MTASLVRAGDAGHAMTEPLDDAFEIHGDHRLVLDDQHIGGDLRGDLAPRGIDQRFDVVVAGVEDDRGLVRREAFDGAEQEGLTRQRRDLLELAVDGRRPRLERLPASG